MSNPQFAKLFLKKMHSLVREKKRHFVPRTYPDGTSYLKHLAKLGLESVDEAWEYILQLDEDDYVSGPEKDMTARPKSNEKVIWTFKTKVDGKTAYIKLKDEENRRGCVCLSFHEDQPKRKK